MANQPPVAVELSHDAAMVITDILAAYFYGGSGPMNDRLSPIQVRAMSELLFVMEKAESVSPIYLGNKFEDLLRTAEANILADIEGRAPSSQS